MKIGSVGSGNVGGTLGRLWSLGGHEVCFGVRDPGAGEAMELRMNFGEGATAVRLEALAVAWIRLTGSFGRSLELRIVRD